MKTTLSHSCKILFLSIFIISCEIEDKNVSDNFSHDGDYKIIYLSNRNGVPIEESRRELFLLEIDSMYETQLTFTSNFTDVTDYLIFDDQIIFSSIEIASQLFLDIYRLNLHTKMTDAMIKTKERIDQGIYLESNIPWHVVSDISQSGDKILYIKEFDGNYQLFSMNFGSLSEKQIIPDGNLSNIIQARLSPNGKKIALTANSETPFWNVYIMDSDGNNLKKIGAFNFADSPVWSPDGNSILFAVNEGPYNDLDIFPTYKVYKYTLTDQSIKKISSKSHALNPQWSHDGNRILYLAGNSSGELDIYIADPNGNSESQITHLATVLQSPKWSFDDQKIIVTLTKEGQIYMLNSDGSNLKQVSKSIANGRAAWLN